jgi:hypothetical protein
VRYFAATAALAFALFLGSTAHAAVTLEVIDRGTPTDGIYTMTGYRAFTVRLTSSTGDITRISFPIQGGMAGNFAQRWEDVSASGNYTTTSPGFLTADNIRLRFTTSIAIF